MHPFLLKIISTQIGRLTSAGTSLNPGSKDQDGFLSAVQEAGARIGRAGSDKTPSVMIRPAGSVAVQAKDRVAGKKDRESAGADLRDLTPLAVLLHEAGIRPERVRSFLDSLMAHAPDAKMPVEELLGRIRSMILVEKDGDGRLLLEPGARLRVESALTQWGFSPKEADRALSFSDEGEVDVERFVRATLLQQGQGKDRLFKEDQGEPKPAGAGKIEDMATSSIGREKSGTAAGFESARARVPGTPLVSPEAKPGAGGEPVVLRENTPAFKGENRSVPPWLGSQENTLLRPKAAEKTTAKQGSEGNNRVLQAEPTGKSNPLSVPVNPADGGDKEAQIERTKGWAGPESSARAAKETRLEEGAAAAQSRAASPPGPGSHQNWVKAAGTQGDPPFPEHLLPAHVLSQVSKQVSRALLSGDQTIRLQLNPPQLGALRVQLEWNQDNLRIEMITDRYPVKEILLSSVAELKQTLGEQGFRVDKMEVHVEESFGRNLSPFDQERRDPAGTGAGAREEALFFSEGEKGSEGPRPFKALEGRLLDLLA
jgi:hypothetical protein